MTKRDTWKEINQNQSKLLFNLYERWQNEKDHEDIQDYLTHIQKTIPTAYTITKRPFGMK